MTNDLFRDYLDGKIRVRKRIKPGIYFLPAGSFDRNRPTMRDLTNAIGLTQIRVIDIDWCAKPTPPTDPRARALWAKQSRGNGPTPEPLRVRSRNNHYKEKP